MTSNFLFILLIFFISQITEIKGHGMLLDPPGRSSRWRFNSSAPINYNDNTLWCGGLDVQWQEHGGKCGLCGDDYGLPTPRPNEIGGMYGGSGVIVKNYYGKFIRVQFNLTANHRGHVLFNLCNLDECNHESEACFEKHLLKFIDGSNRYFVGNKKGGFAVDALLPQGVSCKHCVLRWTYIAANNWGKCENGTSGMGCGPHEHYKNCADISIQKLKDDYHQPVVTTQKPFKPTTPYYSTTTVSIIPVQSTEASHQPTGTGNGHIKCEHPLTNSPVVCNQNLRQELFTEREVNQLTLDLVTKLGACTSRQEQFRVITQLAIKYLYTDIE